MSILKPFSLASFPPVTIISIAKNLYCVTGACAKDGQNRQGAPALKLCRNAESFSERCAGFSVLLVEWPQLQNMKLSKTVCSKWNGTSDKLVLSAASGWGAGKVRCNSLFLLMIVIVQICFCKITWETLPYRQLINVTPLKLLMGLEMSIIDLRHHDYFKSQLRFSLLN